MADSLQIDELSTPEIGNSTENEKIPVETENIKLEAESKKIATDNDEIAIDLKNSVRDLKKDLKTKIYTKKPKKLPKKADMVKQYLDLCKKHNKEPEHPEWKLKKNIKKDELWEMIERLDGKDSYEVDQNVDDKIQEINISKSAKKHAANFMFEALNMTAFGVETYFNNKPKYGIDIDGYAYEMQKSKKELMPDIHAILEEYPIIATYLNPILTLSAKMANAGLKRHRHNSEFKKKNNHPSIKVTEENRLPTKRNKRKTRVSKKLSTKTGADPSKVTIAL